MADMMVRVLRAGTILLLAALIAGCELLVVTSLQAEAPRTQEGVVTQMRGGDRFPDVLDAELRPRRDGSYDVVVTMSSPWDSPERYADGWRVVDPDGNVLGSHTLFHDHADEQPFTRTQRGLVIPEGVTAVTVQGRDQANGYGGLSVTIAVPETE